jgi:asparagine synthase (glutamine-hydrolysing)
MCGFCGIYEPTGTAGIDPGLLRQMTGLMAERGPDAEGFWSDNRIGLGHRRLTIIDLAAGEQPVYNEDRSLLVVFNGEIFNYQELRRELIARGHRFSTQTDTEVIVHAYEEYGTACVQRFRGMFAFALYDTRQGSLFMARDRLGVKPLYYSLIGSRLAFASEVKPVLLARGGVATPEPAAIDFFTAVGYVPGEDTMFQGVKKLLPGHYMTWKPGQSAPHIERYWDVPDNPARHLTLDEATEEFQALLRESVRLRLISDVPVGAFLSGGVDSSVIVAQMGELTSTPVKTFSIGYGDSPEHNELPHARVVADHLRTDHVEHVLTHGDFFENVAAFVQRSEEPIVESAGIALYHLARVARRDVTVVLSGEGGDEALAGYPLYNIMRKVDRLRSLARPLGGSAIARALAGRIRSEKAAKYLDWIGTPLADRYWSIPNDFTRGIRSRMYTDGFQKTVGTTVADYFGGLYGYLKNASQLKRMSYVDLKSWLPDDLLIKADKMTMAASVELRVPFLDHKLIEFCLSLPDEMRLNGDTAKYLLKRTAEKWLPKSIIYRKKQGFPVPISLWFREKLYDRVAEVLLDPRTLNRGYFRPEYVRGILARHKAGHGDYSRRLLSLVILETWHRTFVDEMCLPLRSLRAQASAPKALRA